MTEFNTKLIHVPDGEKFDGSVTVPIYKATTYQYPSVERSVRFKKWQPNSFCVRTAVS